jgi:hypothetical protein
LLAAFQWSEQPSFFWPSPVLHHIRLAFKSSKLRYGTAAAVNQTAAPSIQPSPSVFDCLKAAGNKTRMAEM